MGQSDHYLSSNSKKTNGELSYEELLKSFTEVIAEKNKVRAIIESVSDGVYAVDWDGRVILLNTAGEGMIGFKKEEVLGKFHPEVIKILDREGDEIPLWSHPLVLAFTQETPVVLEDAYLVGKDGKRIPVRFTASLVKGHGNSIVSGIATFSNIHKEKELERMKMDFVAIAVHQLRSPAVSLKGYLSTLLAELERISPEEKRKFINRAYESSLHLEGLINRLLSVSRIEEGTLQAKIENCKVDELVLSVINNFLPEAKKKNISLNWVSSGRSLPDIKADKGMVKEILSNLISNSIIYTPLKGKIEISAYSKDNEVVVGVKDTGAGISKENIKKLFKRFSRASSLLTQETSGIGLGLYISKSLIEMQNGKIWAESKGEGKGSFFFFSLPRAS